MCYRCRVSTPLWFHLLLPPSSSSRLSRPEIIYASWRSCEGGGGSGSRGRGRATFKPHLGECEACGGQSQWHVPAATRRPAAACTFTRLSYRAEHKMCTNPKNHAWQLRVAASRTRRRKPTTRGAKKNCIS